MSWLLAQPCMSSNSLSAGAVSSPRSLCFLAEYTNWPAAMTCDSSPSLNKSLGKNHIPHCSNKNEPGKAVDEPSCTLLTKNASDTNSQRFQPRAAMSPGVTGRACRGTVVPGQLPVSLIRLQNTWHEPLCSCQKQHSPLLCMHMLAAVRMHRCHSRSRRLAHPALEKRRRTEDMC